MERFYEVGFIRLSNLPELNLRWEKELIFFFFLNRPLLLPQVVKSDFEIKEFYLTFESDVTYFIYLQANYVHILLSEPHQWVSEKSRMVREEENFCLLYCILRSLWSNGNHCFHSLSSERCGGGPEHRHPYQGEKTVELCIPLIFVNAKCILSEDLRFHITMHQKIRSYFSHKESMLSTVVYCFCVANQAAWKKNLPCFLKGQHKLWLLWFNLTVHHHELLMFQLSDSCKWKQYKIKTVYGIYHIKDFLFEFEETIQRKTFYTWNLVNFSKCFFWLTMFLFYFVNILT